jgi:CubicO group peptidase (beta-lactamase class C family)
MNTKKLFIKYIILSCTLAFIVMLSTINTVQANRGAEGFSKNQSYEELDAYIVKRLDALNIPGASLVVVEGDKIVHTKGFGVTHYGGETPTPQTPYFIGSLTKSFTALAVMQLVEAGKIELDVPIQHYLPWFTLADPGAAAQITVRHLLNQTSGFSQITGMINMSNFDTTPGAMERQGRALATTKLANPVGSTMEYSNINYNLLGLVIEAASGETYADYIQNHIFTPLDMRHSYTSKDAAQKDGLAVGHQQWFGFPVAVPNLPVPVGSLPSGQLISSVEDIGHYLIAQQNKGEYSGTHILSPGGMAEMHQPASKITNGNKEMGDYGMGWFIIKSNQVDLVFHDGEVPDYFSYMAFLPKQNRGMALLVNTNEQMFNYALWSIGEKSALMLAGIPPQPNAWFLLPWAVRGFLFLPVLQIIAIFTTIRRIDRWKMNPSSRPGTTRMWLLHIFLPTILNLVLVFIAAAILAGGMFKFIMLFMGDITSVLLVSGVIALVWLIVRSSLILRTFQSMPAEN